MELTIGREEFKIDTVSSEVSLRENVNMTVTAPGREDCEDPFYIVDLGRVLDLHRDWVSALPTVTPFYAVKCNEDPALLKTLAALGTGFDCASKNEIKGILEMGVSPDRIVYANPCKQASHLKYAARKGVSLMTFDNELELHKVKKHYPTARLVLRIRADDPDAICQLGVKFGCSLSDGKVLLNTANNLGLNVVGISFHVGSGSQSPTAYELALEMSAELFQYGKMIGYDFTLLDIGGGYPGDKGSNEVFRKVTSAINKSRDVHFNSTAYPGLKIIAEPGRYFACSTHTIAVNVISKRACNSDGFNDGPKFMYYVNDGVYGSFNCILFDHVTPTPTVLKEHSRDLAVYPSSLWGPTCDGLDKLGDSVMPELEIGDWIYFDNMGAYTVSASTSFNGFLMPKTYYYVTEAHLDEFQQLHFPPSASHCPPPCHSPTPSLASSTEDSLTESEEDELPLTEPCVSNSQRTEIVVVY